MKRSSIHTIFYRNNFILKSFKLKWVRLHIYIKYTGLAFCSCVWKLTHVFPHASRIWSIFNLYIHSLIVLRNLVAYNRFLHHLNFQMITNSTYKYLVKYRELTVARELKIMRRVIEIKEMHYVQKYIYLHKSITCSSFLSLTVYYKPW